MVEIVGAQVRSLRGYLVAMSVLLVLLFCAGSALLLRQLAAVGRAENERQLLDTTRALSLAVDGRLQSYESLLLALRGSGAFQTGEWGILDARARDLLSGPDAWIVVADRQGRQLVNTRLPRGAKLPSGPPPAEMWSVLDRGQTHYCDLTRGLVEPSILCVDVPVMKDGRAVYHLSVIYRPELLQQLVSRQRLDGGRIFSIVDRKRRVVWRNIAPERFIGHPATGSLRHAMDRRPEGVLLSVSLDGVPTLAAYSRSTVSGWSFVVAVPRQQMSVGSRQALQYGLAGAAILLLVASGLAVLLAGRIDNAVRQLGLAAERIRGGERPHYRPSGLREIDAVGSALDAAVLEREASQERFNFAQEVGGIGSWEWDSLKDEGHVSEAYKQMHGLTHISGPLRLAQVMAVIHPEDLPLYQQRLAAARKRTDASTNEYRVVRPDGSIRWIYAKGRPIIGPDGEMTGAIGVVIDLTERKEAEERLRLLMREVDHRANNLMAVVQGAVSLSRADDAEELRAIIVGRVEALARAHQLLAASRWEGADLRRLADDEMRPYTLGDAGRVRIEGPSLTLPPAAAQGVAMALHELATNAAKHGALSTPSGRVDLTWRVADGRLHLRWEESGGPAVEKPAGRGFGTTVLQRALGGPIGGSTRLDWRREGLACDLELPLERPTSFESGAIL